MKNYSAVILVLAISIGITQVAYADPMETMMAPATATTTPMTPMSLTVDMSTGNVSTGNVSAVIDPIAVNPLACTSVCSVSATTDTTSDYYQSAYINTYNKDGSGTRNRYYMVGAAAGKFATPALAMAACQNDVMNKTY